VTAARAEELGVIERIETLRWRAQPNVLWVLVHTSAGITGLGETYYLPGAVEAVIHDLAAGLLLGRPASRIGEHWTTLFSCANFSGFAGAELRAVSALDVALWDALGKATGRPVYDLLGGRCREEVPVYNTCVTAGPYADGERFLDAPGELAAELLEQGYRGMKVWPWDPYAPQIRSAAHTGPAGWSAMGPVGHYLGPRELAAGLRVVEGIRESVGDDLEILVEGHARWDLATALRIARALEPYDVLWMEDPIQPDSPDDLRRLVEETSVPQAVSERLMSRHPFRQVLERKAAHVVMLDVAWTGGLSEARRIADLADTYHLPFAPHDCTGPVTAVANLHLAVSASNAMITEVVRGFVDGYYTDVLDTRVPVGAGTARPPDLPGLGVALRPGFRDRADVTVRASGDRTAAAAPAGRAALS
jgi:L-alanine-DL-glutamate epimerase-like enolase superfamily enzyme